MYVKLKAYQQIINQTFQCNENNLKYLAPKKYENDVFPCAITHPKFYPIKTLTPIKVPRVPPQNPLNDPKHNKCMPRPGQQQHVSNLIEEGDAAYAVCADFLDSSHKY